MFKNTAQFFLYANRSQMLLSPPLIYSVSSKYVFIAVSDFGAQKKKNLVLPVQFLPSHPGKVQIPVARKDSQIKFLNPRAQKINMSHVGKVCLGGGGLKSIGTLL